MLEDFLMTAPPSILYFLKTTTNLVGRQPKSEVPVPLEQMSHHYFLARLNE